MNDEDTATAAEEEAVASLEMVKQCMTTVQQTKRKKKKIDHRHFPRNPKRKFRHDEAVHCIKRDYLGIEGDLSTPIFAGKEFVAMFRITRSRFERLMQDFANSGDPFFTPPFVDCTGQEGASLEARLLLPLKSISFGVPPKTFSDYFQMSGTLAKDCYNNYNKRMTLIYRNEYLRLPTKADLKNIVRLHKSVHRGINGLFGSLDCMHTHWNKCPVAWQGSHKGKEKKPSIVLEGLSDHHMWFWHSAYGFAGTLNDVNILNLSPLLEALLDGTFEELEQAVVPFTISEEEFNKLFIFVDGIYPRYSRFVKGMKEPVTDGEKALTSAQESARKDVERAFGNLQAKFQAMAKPIVLHDLLHIADLCSCCLIMHNMCVSDRVMDGDVRAIYNPANDLLPETEEEVEYSEEFRSKTTRQQSPIGIANADPSVVKILQRKERWNDLVDLEEYTRLHRALMEHLTK